MNPILLIVNVRWERELEPNHQTSDIRRDGCRPEEGEIPPKRMNLKVFCDQLYLPQTCESYS